MKKYTNDKNVSLPMAVWLAHDQYSHDSRANVISVTALMRPVRQLILSKRLKVGEGLSDISMLLAARLGTAIHSAIEHSWLGNYKQSLTDLGYPNAVVNGIEVNPETPNPNKTQVYLELRSEKKIRGWIVSGECDMICDFHVHDVKSTSVGMYLKGTKDDDYSLQMSMYRWLNPDKITEDRAFIEFLFKDWSLITSFHTPNYPQIPVLQHPVMLNSINETEKFIENKLFLIESLIDTPEPDLPLCTDKELWRDPPTYQYFGKITNARASKNFPTYTEANSHLLSKGTGIIKTKPSKAMACLWCSAAPICSQYADLKANNQLVSSD